MNRLLLALLPLALAACAAAPATQEVALAPTDKDAVCEREARTGTILPTTRCRTAAQREADRRDVDAAGDSLHRGVPISTSQKAGS